MLEIHYARRSTRFSVAIDCQIFRRGHDESAELAVTSLSSVGAWIATSEPVPIGERVVLTFRPPNWSGPDVTVFGEVARIVCGRANRDKNGMGLEFLDLTDTERRELDGALRALPRETSRRTQLRRWHPERYAV